MEKALAVARTGFRRFFSISAFTPPPPATVPPPAEPSLNLFVSGLSKRTTSEGLREAFSKYGNVTQARVVTDRVSGYSKGFGFVKYATIEEAAEGIQGMDGKFLDGWVIFAEYARPRPPPSSQSPVLNTSSAAPSNYTSPTSPSWSSYQSSQPSEPVYSHSSYTPQETQTPSNYSNQSAQTWQTQPNYSSETSQPPSNFASISGYSQALESQPECASGSPLAAPSSHTAAPPNHLPQNSEIQSEITASTKYQTSKPSSDCESRLTEY